VIHPVTSDVGDASGYPAGMTQHFDDAEARERLEHERERLNGLIDNLKSEGLDEEEASQSGELTHYDQHPADQASETFEREKDLAILEGLEQELAEIEAALQRIDDGTYGIDEVTGQPIDPERLRAAPSARTNIDTNRVQ
jgi:RNA polymerase-binding transcription factor DksA